MAGILPEVFWGLTWCDYDALLFNHRYREQQALAGHRAVATEVYNALQSFVKHGKSRRPWEHWALPLVDPPAEESRTYGNAAWWAKMEALANKSGKRFANPVTD